MEKIEWYEEVSGHIQDNLYDFYQEFYGASSLKKLGASGYRMNPCPVCGHNESCTIKDNTVHCFSGECGWSGTHINAWYFYAKNILNLSLDQAIQRLEKFCNIPFPTGTKEEMEAFKKHRRLQDIQRKAENFYHMQLFSCQVTYDYNGTLLTPIEYMLKIRKRQERTLRTFKVGFSYGYYELFHSLLEEGYTREEIKEAKIWAPEGLFTFFYKHPKTKDIVRMNTKNPFLIIMVSTDENGEKVKNGVIEGFSTGDKSLFFSPDFDFNKDVVVVEGEHDLFSVWEQGESNVCATGGTIEKEYQFSILNRLSDSSIVYTFYDNDASGDKYITFTNEYLADKDVRRIIYHQSYKDPDDYFKSHDNLERLSINELKERAEKLKTDKYKIRHSGNMWTIATRDKKLEFTLKNKTDKGSLTGSVAYYANGALQERDEDISLMKCKAKVKPLNYHLHDEIEKYFNSNLGNKHIDELVGIYMYSSKKNEIIKVIAEKLYSTEIKDDIISNLKVSFKKAIGSDDPVDLILKEMNQIQNKSKDKLTDIYNMRICQHFNIRHNQGYMYFTYLKMDGDVIRKLPFLLRNDKTLIRLDLLKRKDSQCLLLVDNRYELPYEVNEAIIDLRECSLTQDWVEKFIDNKIPDEELKPIKLIKKIEGYLRKFYYTNDQNIYKVLALYIYMTYYYELFGEVPYLFLNGEKGSGKSILDTVIYLLAFNAKMAVDISESSLFRMVAVEGGTIILDEMENLTSRSKTQDSTMASVLKSGYARTGSVYRYNTETNSTEGFNAYGPKVISNIFGIDDVIEDRCIAINTYRLKITKETKMEDPKYYMAERLDEIREVTSKCAISALLNFQKLHKIFEESVFVTGNARLSQILNPIASVAKLVDEDEVQVLKHNNPDRENIMGTYENALVSYYNDTLSLSKENIDCDTPEGIIKRAVVGIANELLGKIPQKDIEYTISTNHKYTEPIKYDKDEGWFDVNVLHLKCFIEESMPGDTAYTRLIPKWLKTVFKVSPKDIKRKTAHVESEDMLKEFKGNSRPKVTTYRFYFKDFIDNKEAFFIKPAPQKGQEEIKLF